LCIIEKRRQEAAPARIGRKKKKRGVELSNKLPAGKDISSQGNKFLILYYLVNPLSKCRLRLLRLDRIKDYLLMEEEFIKN
jgi:26S proteasome regulatory subunit T2